MPIWKTYVEKSEAILIGQALAPPLCLRRIIWEGNCLRKYVWRGTRPSGHTVWRGNCLPKYSSTGVSGNTKWRGNCLWEYKLNRLNLILMIWTSLDSFEPIRSNMSRFGSIKPTRIDLNRFGLIWAESDLFESERTDLNWFGLIWMDSD